MSILIKGLEMPKSCNGCPMNLAGHCMAYKGLYVERKNLEYNSKPEWCPIPPHGRLIDADEFIIRMTELVQKAKADGFDLGAAWYTAFIRHIELAPTIIEAEEK